MVKVVTVEQMRVIEKATDDAGVSYAEMMQHAGRAVAEILKGALGEDSVKRRVVVLVGPGNNGGDGLVAARILSEETDAEISAYLLKPRGEDNDKVYQAAIEADIFIANAEEDQRWRVLKRLVREADIVVDALIGTGARLPIEGDLKKLLTHATNAMSHNLRSDVAGGEPGIVWPGVPMVIDTVSPLIVAVDCPSGLDCDTGEIDPVTLTADLTVTFAAAKLGQLKFPGAASVGELIVAGIGTPEDLSELNSINIELTDGISVSQMLPARPSDSYKGTFGRAMMLAGSINYPGAATLAGEAAYRAGAGLITMAIPQAIYPILAANVREVTWLLLPHSIGVLNLDSLEVFREEAGEYDALLLGPGLGREDDTMEFMRGLLQGQRRAKKGKIGFGNSNTDVHKADTVQITAPLIIDADGLNLLSDMKDWSNLLPENTILTPHPGEMARLANIARDEIQQNRIDVASEKAKEWGTVIVLKGAFTVVASPDGRVMVTPFATDALATAGTGDVLAGIITGFVAQGLSSFDAAVVGTYLHGLAGRIAGETLTNRAVLAGDVLEMIPEAFKLLE